MTKKKYNSIKEVNNIRKKENIYSYIISVLVATFIGSFTAGVVIYFITGTFDLYIAIYGAVLASAIIFTIKFIMTIIQIRKKGKQNE